MTLRKDQLKRIESRVVQDILRLGRVPTEQEIKEITAEELAGRRIGKPSFNFKPIAMYEQSNPTTFNQETKQIEEDIEVCFNEMTNQRGHASSLFTSYELERDKVEERLNKQIHEVSLLSNLLQSEYTQIFGENFQTLEHTETDISHKTNAERTSAFVNLREGNVTLSPMVKSTVHHILDVSKISVHDVTSSYPVSIDEFENALNGCENTAWSYIKRSKTETQQELRIDIDLGTSRQASKVQITIHSIKPTEVEVQGTLSDNSTLSFGTYIVENRCEWFFDKEVREIRVLLKKSEADEEENGEFIYHFGISNLQVKQEFYTTKESFVSKEYEIEAKDIEEVSLSVKDLVFAGTHIDYFFGFERESSVDWQKVEKNNALRIQKRERIKEEVNENTANYGELYQEIDGMSYYVIHNTSGKIIDSITAGNDMWKRETKRIEGLGEEGLPTAGQWFTIRGSDMDYIHVDDTMITSSANVKTTARSLEKYSINLESSSGEHILNQSFHIKNDHLQVYLNGQPIYPSVSREGTFEVQRYNYRLQKGRNKIEIIMYTEATPISFKPNIQFGIDVKHVVAEERLMIERPIEDFLHNTSKRDTHFYAIDEEGYVIINYDPVGTDASRRGVKFSTSTKKEAPVSDRMKVRFMAVLSRSNEYQNVTPVLKSYEIKVK